MKTPKLLMVVIIMAIIVSLMPTMAFADGHGGGHGYGHGYGHSNVSIGIGIGFPLYGGYGYWGEPAYYPYYPCYQRVVYASPPPPYYPSVVIAQPAVVAAPVVVRTEAQPIAIVKDDAITSYVNVTNSNGSITPVRIRRIGTVYVGPRGEQYLSYPTVEQLKPVYGF